MSTPIAITIKHLIAAGVTGDALVTAVAEIEAAIAEMHRARERERRRKLPPDWGQIRDQVLARDGSVCAYCHGETTSPHIDHVIPLSRGGSSELTNLVVACPRCNISKGDRTPEEWGGGDA
jgi:5-methylcytosine-specific restriction endonuclease McrA